MHTSIVTFTGQMQTTFSHATLIGHSTTRNNYASTWSYAGSICPRLERVRLPGLWPPRGTDRLSWNRRCVWYRWSARLWLCVDMRVTRSQTADKGQTTTMIRIALPSSSQESAAPKICKISLLLVISILTELLGPGKVIYYGFIRRKFIIQLFFSVHVISRY